MTMAARAAAHPSDDGSLILACARHIAACRARQHRLEKLTSELERRRERGDYVFQRYPTPRTRTGPRAMRSTPPAT